MCHGKFSIRESKLVTHRNAYAPRETCISARIWPGGRQEAKLLSLWEQALLKNADRVVCKISITSYVSVKHRNQATCGDQHSFPYHKGLNFVKTPGTYVKIK